MDKIEFKKLLFKVAFCTMACDGHIDKREIDEMKVMDKNTSFFDGVDLSGELVKLIDEFSLKGARVIQELFSVLRENKLNPIQELLILEVAIRIINSDQKHDENEVRFIHLLRAKLDLHDETIKDRFGEVSLFRSNEYTNNIVMKDTDDQFAKSISLPELTEFNAAILELKGTD